MNAARALLDLVALVGGTIHSMVPGDAPRIATVLVRDQKLEILPADAPLPAGTATIDCTGKHLVPGLIDAMVNFDREHDALYVASGITTVRDMGGDRERTLLEQRAEQRERTPGPWIYSAGAVIDGWPPATEEAVILRDAAAAEQFLPLLFDDGIDFVSIYSGLTPEAWTKTIEMAHRRKLAVWGPLPKGVFLAEACAVGQDGFLYVDSVLPAGATWEGVLPKALEPAEKLLAEAKKPLVPVLQAFALQLVDQGKIEHVDALLSILAPSYEMLWRSELAFRGSRMTADIVEAGKKRIEKQRALVKRLFDLRVAIVPGSAAPHPWLVPGQSFHQELEQLARAGLSAADVLRLATRGAAEALGIAHQRGALATGLVADVLVLGGDPTVAVGTDAWTALEALRQPELVVLRGRVLDGAKLEEMIQATATAQREARERLSQPIEVAAPPVPDGGTVILEGTADRRQLDMLSSSERYNVVREKNGRTTLTGRIAFSRVDPTAPAELLIAQSYEGGKLVEFTLLTRLLNGDQIVVNGQWIAEGFRIRRELNGKPVDTVETKKRPVAVQAGSVTLELALGQLETKTPFSVLVFHNFFEPEIADWEMRCEGASVHLVKTTVGGMRFDFTPLGALHELREVAGIARSISELVSENAFGGPGFALPKSKLLSPTVPSEAGPVGPVEAGGEVPVEEKGEAPAPEDGREEDGGGEDCAAAERPRDSVFASGRNAPKRTRSLSGRTSLGGR